MSGIGSWECNKHGTTGFAGECPDCRNERIKRILAAFGSVASICEPCTVKKGRIALLEAQTADLQSHLSRALEVLRKVEWFGKMYLPDGSLCRSCVSCGAIKLHESSPHSPDCALAEVLRG